MFPDFSANVEVAVFRLNKSVHIGAVSNRLTNQPTNHRAKSEDSEREAQFGDSWSVEPHVHTCRIAGLE
jgi:hypothetical protein